MTAMDKAISLAWLWLHIAVSTRVTDSLA